MDQQTKKNLLELVKRNYEEIAADFDNTRKKYLWPEIKKLAGPVEDGSRVLDVGCGNGRLAGAFLGKDIKYLGVDNNGRLIEAAKKNFSKIVSSSLSSSGERQRDPGIQDSMAQTSYLITNISKKQTSYGLNLDSRPPERFCRAGLRGNDKRETVSHNDNNNFKFQVGDILELDKLPEKNFNYIFCLAVLHHLPGENLRIKALRQLKNKLKPDGKIIITVWNLWSQAKLRKPIFKFGLFKLIGKNKMDLGDILFDWKNNQGQPISRRYYHAFTRNELKKLAGRTGLKIEKLYKDSYNYYLILRK